MTKNLARRELPKFGKMFLMASLEGIKGPPKEKMGPKGTLNVLFWKNLRKYKLGSWKSGLEVLALVGKVLIWTPGTYRE